MIHRHTAGNGQCQTPHTNSAAKRFEQALKHGERNPDRGQSAGRVASTLRVPIHSFPSVSNQAANHHNFKIPTQTSHVVIPLATDCADFVAWDLS
jgi:hypothetical protein